MNRTIFHISVWRTFIAELSKELGYMQYTQGVMRDGITIQMKPEQKRLILIVNTEDNSKQYTIENTKECLEFCMLMRAIDSVQLS